MERLIHFIANHWLLWATLVVVLVLIIIEETKDKLSGVRRLSPQELTQMINRDQAVVIDIRDKAGYDTGHIIEAINIPFEELATAAKKLEKFKDKALVIVCNTGQKSAAAISKLRKENFNLYSLAGGLNAWKSSGLPLTKK